MIETAVGVDVGGRRKGFHCCALRGDEIVGGPTNLQDVKGAVAWIVARNPTVVALDSPRSCADPGCKSRQDEKDFNKAEICRIRWTPARSELAGNRYYEWIEHGLLLYDALVAAGMSREDTIETFPTAAWTILAGRRAGRSRARWSTAALADLELHGVPARHSQDDRDAIAAALVARLHAEGETQAFGEIILPAGDPPGGRRRARTSPAPPAATRGRPAPDRPG